MGGAFVEGGARGWENGFGDGVGGGGGQGGCEGGEEGFDGCVGVNGAADDYVVRIDVDAGSVGEFAREASGVGVAGDVT